MLSTVEQNTQIIAEQFHEKLYNAHHKHLQGFDEAMYVSTKGLLKMMAIT